ncbi:MAG: hypothetical protein L0229_26320 [Blastocatellia bacterium]|nr:hypothetical protein [Blastocatellia bacterium]
MYCPSCGAESTGLKYCKHCGINLTLPVQMPEQSLPSRGLTTGAAVALSLATTAIGLGGLGIVFATASELAGRSGVDEGIPIVMLIFGSATVFGIIALLITTLSRAMGLSQKPEQQGKRRTRVAGEHRAAPRLAPPAASSSVTEHTTRNFEQLHSRYPDVRE